MNVIVQEMDECDWDAVAEIYKQGIATGHATFQQDVPSWQDWDASHLETCRLVAKIANEVVGWAALTPVSDRCVYAGVAEVSVYVSAHHRGKNIGLQLLDALISLSEQHKLWTLQAGIFPENTGSIHLHEKSGFRKIGYREKIGKMNGAWRDTWQFERRSKIAGR
ncbi:MAG: N-acetyltransferase family protein [Ginsengibacter sp.]